MNCSQAAGGNRSEPVGTKPPCSPASSHTLLPPQPPTRSVVDAVDPLLPLRHLKGSHLVGRGAGQAQLREPASFAVGDALRCGAGGGRGCQGGLFR